MPWLWTETGNVRLNVNKCLYIGPGAPQKSTMPDSDGIALDLSQVQKASNIYININSNFQSSAQMVNAVSKACNILAISNRTCACQFRSSSFRRFPHSSVHNWSITFKYSQYLFLLTFEKEKDYSEKLSVLFGVYIICRIKTDKKVFSRFPSNVARFEVSIFKMVNGMTNAHRYIFRFVAISKS